MFENYLECKFKDFKMEGVSLFKCEGCEIYCYFFIRYLRCFLFDILDVNFKG